MRKASKSQDRTEGFDSQDWTTRTARTEQPIQSSHDRAARTGQPGQDNQGKTARTGQQERTAQKDNQDRTARIEQPRT